MKLSYNFVKIIDGFTSISVNKRSNNIHLDIGIEQEKKWDGQYSNLERNGFSDSLKDHQQQKDQRNSPKPRAFSCVLDYKWPSEMV